jgi:pimeloyl-ACP methyl ester carboxylesterase
MAALIARLDVERVDWIGISLGGLIGMRLAEQPNSPIGRLVLVDIGGYIGRPALERIAGVVSRSPSFPNLAALEAYLREVSAPYGPLTDEQWGHIARYGSRQDAAGAWRLHCRALSGGICGARRSVVVVAGCFLPGAGPAR